MRVNKAYGIVYSLYLSTFERVNSKLLVVSFLTTHLTFANPHEHYVEVNVASVAELIVNKIVIDSLSLPLVVFFFKAIEDNKVSPIEALY